MRTTDLTTTGGNDQFYPTPPSVAEKMLAGLDFDHVQSVLEPSAGKGDLILALMKKYMVSRYRHGDRDLDIDACELDPYLRQILKYNFSQEKLNEIQEQREPLRRLSYSQLTQEQRIESNRLENEADLIRKTALHIVNDDFLIYRTYKRYQLILMNPPFADGDKHLLKAIEMQRDGGMVICLLNAETIRNPYTATRQVLKKQLDELEATIEFIEDAFSTDAERKADVDVAIVKIKIPFSAEEGESAIWERMKRAEEAHVVQDAEIHDLVAGDYIERAIQYYNTEVDRPEYGVIVCKVLWVDSYMGPEQHVEGNEQIFTHLCNVEVIDGHGKGSSYSFAPYEFGESVFLTREGAEAALEAKRHG